MRKFAIFTILALTLGGVAAYADKDCPDKTVPPVTTSLTNHVVITNDNLNQNLNTNRSTNTNVNAPVANGGSVTDNSKTTNTNTALGGTGGSVKDSGNSSSTATVKDSGNSTIKNSGNSSSTSQSVSGSSSSGSGNTTTVTESTPRETPSAYAFAVPTAPCRVANAQGGSSGFFSFSLSQSREDKGCTLRELARSFASIGDMAAAHKLLCSTKEAKAAQACEVK
jgi:hypothetical protein